MSKALSEIEAHVNHAKLQVLGNLTPPSRCERAETAKARKPRSSRPTQLVRTMAQITRSMGHPAPSPMYQDAQDGSAQEGSPGLCLQAPSECRRMSEKLVGATEPHNSRALHIQHNVSQRVGINIVLPRDVPAKSRPQRPWRDGTSPLQRREEVL